MDNQPHRFHADGTYSVTVCQIWLNFGELTEIDVRIKNKEIN